MTNIRTAGGGAAVGLALLALAGCGQPQGAAPGGMQKGPPEVYVSTPVARQITDYEEFPGRLESDQTIQIRARVTGYLLRYNFKEGGVVKKDDVLFEVDPQLYEAELALAKGNLLEAQGNYEQAKADWWRARNVSAEATNAGERDKYRGAYVMAEGKLEAAKASLKKAQVNMDYTKVRAPIGGRVSKVAVDPGNLVRADDTVLTSIGSVDPIKAYFDVDERTLVRLLRLVEQKVLKADPVGTPVDMWLADEDAEKDTPRKGDVDFTDTYVDATTGTWRVRGQFDNKAGLLVPGMFVRVRLPIGEARPELLVAEKALVTDQGQKFVYVVKDENAAEHEGKVAYRPVTLGRLHKGLRVVRDGLQPGEKVVVSGLQHVRPDIKVKFKDVEMTAGIGSGDATDPTKPPPAGKSSASRPAARTPEHEKGATKKGH